jgi:CRP-like cAMP-binding protein
MTNLSLEAVQHVPLFVDWNKHEVQEIARLFNEHHFSKGETVVEEGSFGDSSFLIDSGEAGVFHWRQGAHHSKARRLFR